MDEQAHHELIIIKRYEEEEHVAHSSAWKVAHADFMTAMMAFFLIMWLINVTDDEVRKGISQYFNPIHLSQGSTDLKGLNAPDPSNTDKTGRKGPNEPATPTAPIDPVQLTAASGSSADASKTIVDTGASKASTPAAATAASAAAAAGAGAAASASATAGTAAAGAGGAGASAGGATPAPGAGSASTGGASSPSAAAGGGTNTGTGAAYQDPYAALAAVAGDANTAGATSADVIAGDPRAVGAAGGDAQRDPFDPIYWQLSPLPSARAETVGTEGSVNAAPQSGVKPDAAAPTTAPQLAASGSLPPTAGTQATGQSTASDGPPPTGVTPATAPAPLPNSTAAEAAASAIAAAIAPAGSQPPAAAAPQVTVKTTKDGTLISLTDDAAYSMFPVGSATADAKVAPLMAKIATALAAQPGDVIIRGYTDARPFHSANDDNWRLSADRAHAAYTLLVAAGLDSARVVSIEGHADRDPLNPADPLAAENRRIEILLGVTGG